MYFLQNISVSRGKSEVSLPVVESSIDIPNIEIKVLPEHENGFEPMSLSDTATFAANTTQHKTDRQIV